jgi:hypothetical protein
MLLSTMPKAKRQTQAGKESSTKQTKGSSQSKGKNGGGNGKKRVKVTLESAGETRTPAKLAAAYRATEESIESNMLSPEMIKHYMSQIESG